MLPEFRTVNHFRSAETREQVSRARMAPLRVAVFTNQFPGRGTTFFARDIRGLTEAGVEVTVFPLYPVEPELWRWVPAILPPGVLPPDRIRGGTLRATLGWPRPGGPGAGRFARDAAAALASAACWGPEALAKTAFAAGRAWAWLPEFEAGRFDHLLAYWGNYSATAAWLVQRAAAPELPFSMFVHARMDLYRKPAGLARKLAHADNVFVVCEYNRRYLARHYPRLFPRLADRIHVHHLGLDLRAPPRPTEREAALVLAVGRFERLKGHDVLLRAVARLAAERQPVTLELIGGGEEERPLRRLAGKLGIGDRVVFRGWLSEPEVLAAMRRATIFAHPSTAPDAMPTVLKEALAAGTPAVASDLAGIPEILDDGRAGILVPPGEAAALAAALRRLLDDPEGRARLARAGRAHAARRFDLWENTAALAERLRATVRSPRNE